MCFSFVIDIILWKYCGPLSVMEVNGILYCAAQNTEKLQENKNVSGRAGKAFIYSG